MIWLYVGSNPIRATNREKELEMSRYVHCRTCDRPMVTFIVDIGDVQHHWDGVPIGAKLAQCVHGDCEDIGHIIQIHRYQVPVAQLVVKPWRSLVQIQPGTPSSG